MTSVFIAAKNNHTHVLSYLLKVPGVYIDARDKVIYTYCSGRRWFPDPSGSPLDWLLRKTKNAFVGIDHDRTCDYSGCCKQCDCTYLIQWQYTPLHKVVIKGQVDAAKLLIAAGADKNALDRVSVIITWYYRCL